MINIGIDPILVTLGPFSLSWHSLFIVVAIAVGVWLPVRLVAKAGQQYCFPVSESAMF